MKQFLKFFLVFFGIIQIVLLFQLTSNAQTQEWIENSDYDVPIQIIHKIIEAPAGNRRELFIFIEPQHFSQENVKRIFQGLASKYEDPKWMRITMYSDKDMLKRAMGSANPKIIIHWENTLEGKKAAAEWARKYEPLPNGYFRATYFRIERYNGGQPYLEEKYSYSPKADENKMIEISLTDVPKSNENPKTN